MSTLVALLASDDLPRRVRPSLGLCRASLIDLRSPDAITVIPLDPTLQGLTTAIDQVASHLAAITRTHPQDAGRTAAALRWLEIARRAAAEERTDPTPP
ncbi:hypothetical protein [Nocardioides bruguierae]|uniref:Uncharacterized protein n=1 Tax=Nocardioides bruguierae TaxID=2945102 RepID=A0A9X2DCH1_9ACTN|nr:hypothetical protein [Nocardioides bruguierae]MCM0621959.1 hypothetical protein [Nocardioides bruguierae]